MLEENRPVAMKRKHRSGRSQAEAPEEDNVWVYLGEDRLAARALHEGPCSCSASRTAGSLCYTTRRGVYAFWMECSRENFLLASGTLVAYTLLVSSLSQ